MNKTPVNRCLRIYIILCIIFFTLPLAMVLIPHLPPEYSSIFIFTFALPNTVSLVYFVLLVGTAIGENWNLLLYTMVFLFIWVTSVAGVVLSVKSKKPWYIPAIVFLVVDAGIKFFTLTMPDWHAVVFGIVALLLDGLLFFLLWKIRKYATANEPEQAPQKYIDTGLRDI